MGSFCVDDWGLDGPVGVGSGGVLCTGAGVCLMGSRWSGVLVGYPERGFDQGVWDDGSVVTVPSGGTTFPKERKGGCHIGTGRFRLPEPRTERGRPRAATRKRKRPSGSGLAAGGRADHWGPIVHMGASPHDREAVGVVGSRAHVVEGQRPMTRSETNSGRQRRSVPHVAITSPWHCHRNHTHTRCRYPRHRARNRQVPASGTTNGKRPSTGGDTETETAVRKWPCRRWSGGPLGSHRPHGCESPRPRSGGGRGESCTCGRGATANDHGSTP